MNTVNIPCARELLFAKILIPLITWCTIVSCFFLSRFRFDFALAMQPRNNRFLCYGF